MPDLPVEILGINQNLGSNSGQRLDEICRIKIIWGINKSCCLSWNRADQGFKPLLTMESSLFLLGFDFSEHLASTFFEQGLNFYECLRLGHIDQFIDLVSFFLDFLWDRHLRDFKITIRSLSSSNSYIWFWMHSCIFLQVVLIFS